MTPDEYERMNDKQLREALRPYLESDIGRQIDAVSNRMMEAIRKGTLTPELAEAAWRQIFAFKSILKSYQTHIAME